MSREHPRGFASDNNSGAHPDVIAAIAATNEGHVVAYGEDDYTAANRELFRRHFGEAAAEPNRPLRLLEWEPMSSSRAQPAWRLLSAMVTSGAKCRYCGTRDDLVAHHRVPRRLGGPDLLSNLEPGLAGAVIRGSSRRRSRRRSSIGSVRWRRERVRRRGAGAPA